MEEMRTFLKNTLLFCLIGISLALIIIANFLFIYHLCLKSFCLNNSITTVVVGDSHAQSAINDNLFENIVNLSQNSECYFYTYNKLKGIIQRNQRIRTVIVGCTYHSFSSYNDEYLFDRDATKYTFPQYFLALDDESKRFLINNNPAGVMRSFSGIMKNALSALFKYDSSKILFNGTGKDVLRYLFHSNKNLYLSFWGGFYDSEKSNISDSTIAAAINRHYFENGSTFQPYSHLQVYYLNKIVSYCIAKNITVFILTTPVTEKYYSKIPAQFISHYYAVLDNLKNGNSVIALDYHDYRLPDECFGDGDHLNKKGADNFTNFLNKTLMSAGESKPNRNTTH